MSLRPTGLTLALALILGLACLLVTMALQNLTNAQRRALDDLARARHQAEVAQSTTLLAMDLTHRWAPAGAGTSLRSSTPPERLRQQLETHLLQMAQWPVDAAQARLMATVQASAERHLNLTLPADGPASLNPVQALAAGPADDVMASRALLLDALSALAEAQQLQVAQAVAKAHAAQRFSLLLLLGAAGLLLLLGLGLAWRATHGPTPVPSARPGQDEAPLPPPDRAEPAPHPGGRVHSIDLWPGHESTHQA